MLDEAKGPSRAKAGRQGPRKVMGRLQELVLRSVDHLGEGCRVEQIRSLINGRFGHPVTFGAVFTTLDRLEVRGMVSRTKGVPMSKLGGRAPRLYAIEACGRDAISRLDDLARKIASP